MQDEEEFGRLYLVTDDFKKGKANFWEKEAIHNF